MKSSKNGTVLTLGRTDSRRWIRNGIFRDEIREFMVAQASKIGATVKLYVHSELGDVMYLAKEIE